jgi:hypothetical protein
MTLIHTRGNVSKMLKAGLFQDLLLVDSEGIFGPKSSLTREKTRGF